MEEIILNTANQISEPHELRPDLYVQFIRYIDRGERTTQTYINNLRQFAAWLAMEGITRPTRQDLISYRKYLEAEHAAISYDPATGWAYRADRRGNRYTIKCRATTTAAYMRTICQFFRWTAAAGIYPNIAENIHAPKIRSDRHKKDALAPADVRAIEKTIDARISAAETPQEAEQAKRLRAIYLLAVTAGLRTIEISRASVKDLEARNGSAWLFIWGKGHSEPDTRKALAKEVYAAIRDYLDTRGSYTATSPLFVATGNRSGGKRLASTTISTMLKRAMQEAGYDSERLTAHSLRHTAGTNVQGLTGDLYATQKYMRHSNPQTTEIYLHVETDQQDAEIAQRLYDLYHHEGINAGSRRKR